jgi:GNAT superfamily N-acetyltransferase
MTATVATTNILIRPLQANDCAAVADLWLKGLAQTTQAFEGRLIWGPFAAYLMTSLAEKAQQPDSHVGPNGSNLYNFWTKEDRTFYVATTSTDPSTIVGCLGVKRGVTEDVVEPDSQQASVWMVSVLESARRMGVGRQLMMQAEDWAKQQFDANEMYLVTLNPHANAFYTTLGYVNSGWIAPTMGKKLS